MSDITSLVRTGDIETVLNQRQWRWHPEFIKVLLDDPSLEAEVAAGIKAEIMQILERRGYVYTTENDGFWVGFGAAVESRMADDTILALTGMDAGLNRSPDIGKGTLMIALFSPHKKQAQWRVQLQGYTYEDQNQADRKTRLATLITQMLSPIPNISN
ncbi:hypothetical protein [Shewanella sp.]|uniref:hypothetical protein n=1 Tax=Shewanella sp. TaxID=50422 RepID=UPI0035656432